MPFQYVRSDRPQQIRITVTDPVTVADFVEIAEHQLADGAWRYGLLVDARAIAQPPPPRDIRLFIARLSEFVAAHGRRGPIAFVAKESGVIGRAQMYSSLGLEFETQEVFWDARDAQEWLDERIARTPQPESR